MSNDQENVIDNNSDENNSTNDNSIDSHIIHNKANYIRGSVWTEQEVKLLLSWSKSANNLKKAHATQAEKYRNRNKWLNIVITIVGIFAGASGLGGVVVNREDPMWWFNFIISVMTLGAALLNALSGTLGWGDIASGHKVTRSEYAALSRKIKSGLAIPQNSRKDAELFIQSIVGELNDIDSDALGLTQELYDSI